MVFLEYIPGKTFFHRIDIRTKILWLISVIVFTIIFNDPVFLIVLFLTVIVCGKISMIPYMRIRNLLNPLIPILIFMLVFTGFTGPEGGTVWIRIFGLEYTSSGFLLGVGFIVRLLIFVVSFSIFTLTTPLDDFLQLCDKLRLPPGFSIAISTGIRFVPTFQKEMFTIMDARKVRGVELDKKSYIGKLKEQIKVMIPAVISGVEKAGQVTMAMLARGFGTFKRRTVIEKIRMKNMDYVFSAVLLAIVAIGIWLRTLGYGSL